MCKDKLFLKLLDTLNNDHSKNPTIRFLQGVMPPKDMDNIAKSEDLDQSAKEPSDQDLHFYLDLSVQKCRIIMVHKMN